MRRFRDPIVMLVYRLPGYSACRASTGAALPVDLARLAPGQRTSSPTTHGVSSLLPLSPRYFTGLLHVYLNWNITYRLTYSVTRASTLMGNRLGKLVCSVGVMDPPLTPRPVDAENPPWRAAGGCRIVCMQSMTTTYEGMRSESPCFKAFRLSLNAWLVPCSDQRWGECPLSR